uniref:Disease resistance N-terminal domain-containing protein n=1 Tax=Ananas comosus var. bracteatus TaxID=296719 RepID=A0A6V7QWU2_ANACO
MVAAVDITIAGWFVSAVLGKLLEGTIYLAKERKWRSAMRAELDRLEKARPLIEAVAHAAENGDIQVESPPLLQWLQRLKDAVEDADSLLDELELHKLQEQAAANTAANANDLSVLRNVPPLTNLRTLFLHCDADNPKLDVAIDGMLLA